MQGGKRGKATPGDAGSQDDAASSLQGRGKPTPDLTRQPRLERHVPAGDRSWRGQTPGVGRVGKGAGQGVRSCVGSCALVGRVASCLSGWLRSPKCPAAALLWINIKKINYRSHHSGYPSSPSTTEDRHWCGTASPVDGSTPSSPQAWPSHL